MGNSFIKNILRFIILILVQVTILDNINFGGYVNPYLYVYFILLLPFEVPGWLLLISAFLMGISIDVFENTMGINAAATVLMAFFRPVILKSLSSGKEYEKMDKPSIGGFGFSWFFTYSVILIFIHHLTLFYLEVFRFTHFFATLQRAILSTIFTLILVIIVQYIFEKPSK
jgi:rod shape-determining protein MreD